MILNRRKWTDCVENLLNSLSILYSKIHIKISVYYHKSRVVLLKLYFGFTSTVCTRDRQKQTILCFSPSYKFSLQMYWKNLESIVAFLALIWLIKFNFSYFFSYYFYPLSLSFSRTLLIFSFFRPVSLFILSLSHSLSFSLKFCLYLHLYI